MRVLAQIIKQEDALKSAMLSSNIIELKRLLADELVFINHQGRRLTKQDDLELHRSGALSIHAIALSKMQIETKDDFAVVYVNTSIQGSLDGEPNDGDFVFSRVWQNRDEHWQVVSAHATAV